MGGLLNFEQTTLITLNQNDCDHDGNQTHTHTHTHTHTLQSLLGNRFNDTSTLHMLTTPTLFCLQVILGMIEFCKANRPSPPPFRVKLVLVILFFLVCDDTWNHVGVVAHAIRTDVSHPASHRHQMHAIAGTLFPC